MKNFLKTIEPEKPQKLGQSELTSLVSCHAGSLYQNALVLYEKPDRDLRVFVAIINDKDLKFDIYCNDVNVVGLKNCNANLEYNDKKITDIRCYEIGNSNVMSEVIRVVESENKATSCS